MSLSGDLKPPLEIGLFEHPTGTSGYVELYLAAYAPSDSERRILFAQGMVVRTGKLMDALEHLWRQCRRWQITHGYEPSEPPLDLPIFPGVGLRELLCPALFARPQNDERNCE